MPFFVGQECHQVLVKHGLVNAQPFAYVLRMQHPVLCMTGLFPITETAQMILVSMLQVIAIYLKV